MSRSSVTITIILYPALWLVGLPPGKIVHRSVTLTRATRPGRLIERLSVAQWNRLDHKTGCLEFSRKGGRQNVAKGEFGSVFAVVLSAKHGRRLLHQLVDFFRTALRREPDCARSTSKDLQGLSLCMRVRKDVQQSMVASWYHSSSLAS